VVIERWVLNASPLIVLAHIGREDLLFALADEVVVPRAVALEIQEGGRGMCSGWTGMRIVWDVRGRSERLDHERRQTPREFFRG